MKIRYLVDENLSSRIVATIQRHYPELDVLRVGDAGAPIFGTLDLDLLRWLDLHQRVLVTDNRKSMPGHIADHIAAGGHHWGIFMVHKNAPLRTLADTLYVYWDVTDAEQWMDVMEWLPV
jgi:hypothetical protein